MGINKNIHTDKLITQFILLVANNKIFTLQFLHQIKYCGNKVMKSEKYVSTHT